MHFCCCGEAHWDEFGCCGVLVGGGSGGVGGGVPSARIFVAFCSDMPFICSRTLRGLCNVLAL